MLQNPQWLIARIIVTLVWSVPSHFIYYTPENTCPSEKGSVVIRLGSTVYDGPVLEVAIAHKLTSSWGLPHWGNHCNSISTECFPMEFKITKCLLLTSYREPVFLEHIWSGRLWPTDNRERPESWESRFGLRGLVWRRHDFSKKKMEVWMIEGFSLACQINKENPPASRWGLRTLYICDLAKEKVSGLSPSGAMSSDVNRNSFPGQIQFWTVQPWPHAGSSLPWMLQIPANQFCSGTPPCGGAAHGAQGRFPASPLLREPKAIHHFPLNHCSSLTRPFLQLILSSFPLPPPRGLEYLPQPFLFLPVWGLN